MRCLDTSVPAQREGKLIKGKNNASAVDTLVKLCSGYLILAKMDDATATSTVAGFSAALNRMPTAAQKSMTYDQGREMAQHAKITQEKGVAIYFCDPHSLWQRGAKRMTAPSISMSLFINVYRRERISQCITGRT
ncbi:hypothetical protein EHLJMEHL_00428 [Vreelandella titanicae]